jgi:integrase
MAATLRRIPGYLHHRGTGQARVVLNARTIYLGPYGTPASRTRYNRLVAEWLANDRRLPDPSASTVSPTVALLIDAFLDHAEREYRLPDGTPTREVVNVRYPLRLLNEMYGDVPAADFGPRDLKLVREQMIAKGWCRRLVNQRVGVIRRMFRWAVADQRLPGSVHAALAAVPALKAGRNGVRESEPIRPVAREVVAKTVRLLTPTLRAMAWIQWLTGARPGEICALRVEDISTTQVSKDGRPVWVADLRAHKNFFRGKTRRIVFGPRAQRLLRRYVDGRSSGFVFRADVSVVERRTALRAARTTPVTAAQERRDAARHEHPKEQIAERYTTLTYGRAIARAAKRAGVESWSPNQLRHAAATRLRLTKGLETSGACLGHAKLETTQVYAAANDVLALEAMAEVG